MLRLSSVSDMSFSAAKTFASIEAGKYLNDPMVLSWLNRKTCRHSPAIHCCQEEGKETWEIYAESRSGTLRVEVDYDYVFIFREGQAFKD